MARFRVVALGHDYPSTALERGIVEAAGGSFVDADAEGWRMEVLVLAAIMAEINGRPETTASSCPGGAGWRFHAYGAS